MKIEAVSEVLKSADLEPPTLDVLIPDVSNYTALLMQPRGDIEASEAGIHNRDRDLAKLQFSGFLRFAEGIAADLVITPEVFHALGSSDRSNQARLHTQTG